MMMACEFDKNRPDGMLKCTLERLKVMSKGRESVSNCVHRKRMYTYTII